MALLEGAEAAVYVAAILHQLLGTPPMKICCMTDNKSLYEALNSSKKVDDRRLRIDIAVLVDMLDKGEIKKVKWISASQQLADALTKRGVCTERLRAELGR